MMVKSRPTSRSKVWNAPFLTCKFSDENLPETCSVAVPAVEEAAPVVGAVVRDSVVGVVEPEAEGVEEEAEGCSDWARAE